MHTDWTQYGGKIARYVLDAITGRIYSYYIIETLKFSSLLEESDKVYGFFVKSYKIDGL